MTGPLAGISVFARAKGFHRSMMASVGAIYVLSNGIGELSLILRPNVRGGNLPVVQASGIPDRETSYLLDKSMGSR